ncbi:MAG TPA: hypothetical protein VGJ77_19720 [Gaiellaceae bacterium]
MAAARDVYSVAWAPDGRRIAFTRCCVEDNQGLMSFTLVDAVSPDGSSRRTLLRREEDVSNLSWSPDGRRIAYDDGYRLWVATVGGGARLLFRGGPGDFGPIWSPGGSKNARLRERKRPLRRRRADAPYAAARPKRVPAGPGADEAPDWQPLRR